MEKHIILGTAGHIDHGKTALVKALTGTDTDRLKEEKRRGITIELGFASLALPSGQRLGIVDMPGHERFIDHMVAGASGVDLVLLVVAADEGVMPQTVEHLSICSLLGVRLGLVALSKADLVDDEMLELAQEETRDLIDGTFLEEAPLIPVSAVSGAGTQELLEALERLALQAEARKSSGTARMPIDRVFTMRGFGTVATGTLIAGRLAVGDTVEVLPSGQKAKIRGLQVHNTPVKESVAGSRTAVNLQGVEKSAITRGEVLAVPGRFQPSLRVYAQFRFLPPVSRDLPDRFRLVVHWGTSRVFGRIRFIADPSPMKPGDVQPVQIQLESPVFPVFGDRVILRDFSTNQTLGGGVVLDPHAPKFKWKQRAELLPWLERLREADPEGPVSYFFWRRGMQEAELGELAAWTGFSEEEARDLCTRLQKRGEILNVDAQGRVFVLATAFDTLLKRIVTELEAFHGKHPYQEGLQREALGDRLGEPVSDRLLGRAVELLSERGATAIEHNRVRMAGHCVRLSGEDEVLCGRVLETLLAEPSMPPTLKELAQGQGLEEGTLRTLMDVLVSRGDLAKVSDELYYPRETLEDLRSRLVAHLQEKGDIDAATFKTLSRTTRKYTIPLLEYFDRSRVTLRLGDRRVLRERG